MDQFVGYFITGAWTIVNLALAGLIVFALVMLARFINRTTRSRS